ncbi:MAG: hypothetical protein M3024_00990 [Candidatus Dormibacteraeota bacterium]|nr:hypothetical protein [Candidatus Dormibacteraeota bacterium]
MPSDDDLTPRRRETLVLLRRMAPTGEGVHYSDVGRELGVSPWTAYGLLRELQRAGFAVRSYAAGRGAPRGGRSRILFSPVTPAPIPLPTDLPERLRGAFEHFAAIADGAAAASAYVSETLQAGGDLSLHLGFWMTRLEAAGRTASEAMSSILESRAVPAAKIQTLAAMGLGTELSRLGRTRLAGGVVATVTRLSGRLEEAQKGSDATLAALVDAARALLAAQRNRPGAAAP